jgi:hypothetical protein
MTIQRDFGGLVPALWDFIMGCKTSSDNICSSPNIFWSNSVHNYSDSTLDATMVTKPPLIQGSLEVERTHGLWSSVRQREVHGLVLPGCPWKVSLDAVTKFAYQYRSDARL